MRSDKFNYLQRITSSGKFIPEIDGLRFLAILSVVLFHINGLILIYDKHVINKNNIIYNFINYILSHCYLGVPLFFVISGFILSMPFANYYLKGQNKPELKKYFVRRLTRLEPPYIL